MACCCLTAPGIGRDGGTSFDLNRLLFQGLFLAPQMVAEALICAELVAAVFADLGFPVHPQAGAARSDLIQAVKLGSKQALIAVCRAFQAASPVGSYLDPVPAPMPGYARELAMAGCTLIPGSTSPFSRGSHRHSPYVLYPPGGPHQTECPMYKGSSEGPRPTPPQAAAAGSAATWPGWQAGLSKAPWPATRAGACTSAGITPGCWMRRCRLRWSRACATKPASPQPRPALAARAAQNGRQLTVKTPQTPNGINPA